MKAKFDKIMATFVDDQRTGSVNLTQQGRTPFGHIANPQNYQSSTHHNLSEKREGITEFKNKNLQNNVKGMIRGGAKQEDSSEEDESPSAMGGVEQSEDSLNIKINKRKMFSKPPINPIRQ